MVRIGDSELIINSRGAIYHLDIRPEEIADTIITVGDPDRVHEVSKHFDHVEVRRQHREFITHTGTIGEKRLSVVSTGIGPDNIDIVLNELDAAVNIDFEARIPRDKPVNLKIIRIGTSGSLQADIPVDSFVASTHGIGLDNLLHFYRDEKTEHEREILQALNTHTQVQNLVSNPYIYSAGVSLLKNFSQGFHQGMTVTCPGFYAPQGRVLRLGLAMPGLNDALTAFQFGQYRITNFEMETAAIYGLGKLLGHHCLSLNAIVANRVTKDFSANGSKAVQSLITKALEIISSN